MSVKIINAEAIINGFVTRPDRSTIPIRWKRHHVVVDMANRNVLGESKTIRRTYDAILGSTGDADVWVTPIDVGEPYLAASGRIHMVCFSFAYAAPMAELQARAAFPCDREHIPAKITLDFIWALALRWFWSR